MSTGDSSRSKKETGFPIVGIGASAGGLAAFEAFFSGMPADTDPNMAFVLVQHLAPDHKSLLTELIRRYTRMKVFEVEDGMKVRQNCAYIIPPNRDMAFLNGELQLMEPATPRGQRLPIDFFFRSLAADQHERAICIILSGTGSDGTLGLRAIKGEGGMAMVQSCESAEYDGMPRSAIATGLVDFVLPPDQMPERLIAFSAHAIGKDDESRDKLPETENAFKKIFVLMRKQTGHDFSQYKFNTINRRIERRMALQQIEAIDDYIKYLNQMPSEVELLFRDLLIGVTGFFRDPEAFEVLETQVIPSLLSSKSEDDVIRVWSVGCSTGEEAYSLAILLKEARDKMKRNIQAQVFATDIDSQAIATARAGIYPASISADISAERLAQFFTAESGGSEFRINKYIRDMLIFSEQDVIKDPPFSKLDLIICRNLMIYMGGELQKKLIPLFHYSLKPGGYLFLGTSETIGEYNHLFTVIDRTLKVYQRKEGFAGEQRPAGISFMHYSKTEPTAVADRRNNMAGKKPLRDLTEQELLKQMDAAAVLVNGRGDILYFHGRTGSYLEPAPGEAGVSNMLKMAREGLKNDLTTAFHKAVKTREVIRFPGVRVKTNGDTSEINLTISPVAAQKDQNENTQLYLVAMEKAPQVDREWKRQALSVDAEGEPFEGLETLKAGAGSDAAAYIADLKQKLIAKEEYLSAANEELETSNEELKSSNEEMQSVNEELQSTNEELETSKEELQSVNEELSTVNAELQTKVTDLSRAYNDMNNLLAGTDIGTVFVDHALRILRFTPAITKIINLIQSDVGRPVGHIVSNLQGYDTLVEDIQLVLDTLIHKEVEVQIQSGAWYSLRIMPYRTLDNVIEGAVITFVDIGKAKKAQEMLLDYEALRQREALLQNMLHLIRSGGWQWDAEKGTLYWTKEMYLLHGLEPGETEMESEELFERSLTCYEPADRQVMQAAFRQCLDSGKPYDLEFKITAAAGTQHWIRTRAEAVMANGQVVRAFGTLADITDYRPL
jgi:two-component system, chemotaxis family, CheB/CheR fusion protein